VSVPAAPEKAPVVALAPQQMDSRLFEPPGATVPRNAPAFQTDALSMATIVMTDPKVESNGAIMGNGNTVFLYGVKPFDQKTICTGSSGVRWTCGLRAYATLRNMLAHKTVNCDPKVKVGDQIRAVCNTGVVDVALTLIRDGIVEFDDTANDADLANAQTVAKNRRAGIWSP
jgi:endonuclease YncB( thermonuclease family)